jgi:pseudouridine-5'-monophosphatase
MDGLLINTEDIYTIAHNIVLASLNSGPMTWPIKMQLQGRPAHQAITLLLDYFNLTDKISLEEYTAKVHEVQEIEFRKSIVLPGVEKLLRDLKNSGIEIALATSSGRHHFVIKTEHIKSLFSNFRPEHQILGDDSRIPKGRGKPNPDIYLIALKAINDTLPAGTTPITPEECLVFEDGVPGVVAGRRAGMRVVWVPHAGLAGELRGKEDEVLAGLAEGKGDDGGIEGKVGDGWAEQRVTLENFPYEKYGMKIEA